MNGTGGRNKMDVINEINQAQISHIFCLYVKARKRRFLDVSRIAVSGGYEVQEGVGMGDRMMHQNAVTQEKRVHNNSLHIS